MMEISVSDRTDLINSIKTGQVYDGSRPLPGTNEVNPVLDNLVLEGGESFLEYLKWLELAHEPNLLVLSSRHHFFYDQDDLKGVKVLVNLKKLNQIKHLDSYLHILFRVLPPEANFIGCFNDSRNHRSNGSAIFRTGLFYKKFLDFLDYRTDRNMSRSEVTELLDSHGFRIVDMTDLNGMTYFNTRNQRNSGE
jgi:hypothetical protein